MKRILFVDDEQHILDGMRNMLRKNRHVWEMVFVSSGELALAELDRGPFDVIISDMRMPNMDGAALLAAVRERHPRTARFVLSGQADHEAVYRALQYSQQFLSKPCNPQELMSVVQRTCSFQDMISNEGVRNAVGKLGNLPSVNQIYLQLCEALTDPEAPMQKIAEIIDKDPAMVAKLLQLVNSAYFGLAKKTNSVCQAINYLGVDLVKSLTLSIKVFSAFDDPSSKQLVESIQGSSLAIAKLATTFLKDRSHWEATYTASLLHDIGILALVQSQPESYREILEIATQTRRPLHEVEAELASVEHAAVGGYLLGVWGLPFDIVEAVTYHHNLGGDNPPDSDPLLALHTADALLECQQHHANIDDYLNWKGIEKANKKERVLEWLDQFKRMQQEQTTQAPLHL